jgi:argininosuccinate lyase
LDYYSPKFLNHDDVHMNMEARLIDVVGMDVGGRMHTARSRNDQVVLDSKMYARKEVLAIREKAIPAIEVGT